MSTGEYHPSTSSSGNWLWKASKVKFILNSGRNKVFLIDRLLKWTLRRAQVGPVQRPAGDWGWCPRKFFFCSCLKNRRKLAHRKNEILVLFCAMSATDMFTIHRIENSSFVYVKYVFLDISIKGRFECSKFLFMKSKTPSFNLKWFSFTLPWKKRICKKDSQSP